MHIITSSNPDIKSLHFVTDEEANEYHMERVALHDKWHQRLETRHGFWAPNQDKYVQSKEELNEVDREIRSRQGMK